MSGIALCAFEMHLVKLPDTIYSADIIERTVASAFGGFLRTCPTARIRTPFSDLKAALAR